MNVSDLLYLLTALAFTATYFAHSARTNRLARRVEQLEKSTRN
ncbi:hypothetical protein ACIQWB_35400 [Streptomyces olivaceus]